MIQEKGKNSKAKIRERLERDIPRKQPRPRAKDPIDDQMQDLIITPDIDTITVTTTDEDGTVLTTQEITPEPALKSALEKALNTAAKEVHETKGNDMNTNSQAAEQSTTTATQETIMANTQNTTGAEYVTTAERRRLARADKLAVDCINEAIKLESEGNEAGAAAARRRALDYLDAVKKETVSEKVSAAVNETAKPAADNKAAADAKTETKTDASQAKTNDKEEPKKGFFKRHWDSAVGFVGDHKVACAVVGAVAVAATAALFMDGELPEVEAPAGE